ncbi:MAG: leucyl/phenylalanyl-tRNA--protein transferase [Casimicrobiaceae bacterium]
MIPWLRGGAFPPIDTALADPNGLLAAGGDLSATMLLTAYRQGIFPWYSSGQPILWWSPDPRMVLFVAEFSAPRSLRKLVARRRFDVRVDSAFRDVIEACAAPRTDDSGTWITPAMVDAYSELHRLGHAHSVEAWQGGALVGGLYGVAIGRMFYGESMFARQANASKVALVHLIDLLSRREMPIIDCQQETAHLARFGARPIPRREFADRLTRLVNSPLPAGPWNDEASGEEDQT